MSANKPKPDGEKPRESSGNSSDNKRPPADAGDGENKNIEEIIGRQGNDEIDYKKVKKGMNKGYTHEIPPIPKKADCLVVLRFIWIVSGLRRPIFLK